MTELADRNIPAQNARWSFSGPVADGFDGHVAKSVPLYHSTHDLVLNISDFFVRDESLVYDLGCATGQLTAQLAQRHSAKSAKFVGIDSEPDMIAKAARNKTPNLRFETASIIDTVLQPSDFIVSFYTMQFIPAKHRQDVFNHIYASLNWGGGFLLFEKVRAPDARFQDMMTTIYHDWKQHMGFLPAEIMAKTNSLKGVLDPFSTQGNLDLLKRAGFVDVTSVYKFVSFEGFLAVK